jgi:S1-C subfamily serine protease
MQWMPVVLLIGMAGIPVRAQAPSSGLLKAIEAEISTLFETNRRCVVRIHTIYGGGNGSGLGLGHRYTHGTGFLIDEAGHILTVDKAVSDASEIRVTLADGVVSRASFVASDPTSDVAVIRVEDPPAGHIAFGNSDSVRIGHYTFILGNAFGHLLPSIGSVYEMAEGEDLIQITSSVYPSYGGAPVFNSSGSVMGMVWAAPLYPQDQAVFGGASEQPTSVFVIPSNRARRIAETLITRGEMAYGWLGVEVDRESHPVVVTRVDERGPAWRSGIRPGDQIVSYNGMPVAGPFHLERLVKETSPGDQIPIRVKRESITLSTEAQVAMRQPVSREPNTYGQVAETRVMQGVATRTVSSGSAHVETELFSQIESLERELSRLRLMMKRQP